MAKISAKLRIHLDCKKPLLATFGFCLPPAAENFSSTLEKILGLGLALEGGACPTGYGCPLGILHVHL